MRRSRVVAAGAVALAVAGAGAVALAGDGESEGDGGTKAARETAAVERHDLVARVTIDGELGYADEQKAGSTLSGTVTWMAPDGSTARPGHSLFRIDDTRVIALDGERPAWRALGPSTTDGRDVEQLERNLHDLGYDDGYEITVDDKWTAATTAAVKELQDALGLTEDGELELGRFVFLRGPRRVSEQLAKVGDAAGPGRPIVATTSLRREVTASLSADDQGAAKAGDRVDVDLPGGGTARGRIASVGAVAKSSGEDGSSSIDVVVSLPAKGVPPLDKAPVSVSIARQQLRNATVVPIVALIARPDGGYGVELVEGKSTRVVKVTPGMFADGWVQVDGVRPGQRVVVPAA
jgi:hypothetical protein